jgi:hypothetical protein
LRARIKERKTKENWRFAGYEDSSQERNKMPIQSGDVAVALVGAASS